MEIKVPQLKTQSQLLEQVSLRGKTVKREGLIVKMNEKHWCIDSKFQKMSYKNSLNTASPS